MLRAVTSFAEPEKSLNAIDGSAFIVLYDFLKQRYYISKPLKQNLFLPLYLALGRLIISVALFLHINYRIRKYRKM